MGELEGPVRAKVCRDMSDYAGKLVDKARESWKKAGSYEAKGLLPEAASERDKWRDLIYAIQMVCDTINYAKKADGGSNPGNPNKEEILKKVSEIARGIPDKEAERTLIFSLNALVGEEISLAVDRWRDFNASAELVANPKKYIGRGLSAEEYRIISDFSRKAMEDATETAKGLPLIKGGAEIIQKEGWGKHYPGTNLTWLLIPAAAGLGLLAGWLRSR